MTNDCWNQIGVGGDRSCPELKTFIHCRNCPVYSAAGRSLLEKEVPSGYLQEWTDLLRSSVGSLNRVAPRGTISVGIFRLEGEWLALSAKTIEEVTQACVIRTLPHRTNNIILGLVNIRGEIQICISLKTFLGLDTPDTQLQHISPVVYERMIVVEKDGSRWVFPVDEIYGIHRIHPDEIGNVPSTVSKVQETYTKGVIKWQDKSVSYLDDELLFYALTKKLL
ncbi:MAG TPA: chemotaxis protein CheW [Cyanobacteria bacterium UBA11369]|nr:chemotaxis protein CheW [Cyanobacteria bacterium UBA11371]HBE51733.1 chemotaxis protein CheW [Cyanobacteria bacterium UBA11369]